MIIGRPHKESPNALEDWTAYFYDSMLQLVIFVVLLLMLPFLLAWLIGFAHTGAK